MSARNRRRGIGWCAVALACALSGCLVGPDFKRPEPPAVTHYSIGADPVATEAVDGAAQHFSPGARVAGDWWRLFKAPKLDAIVAEAMENNPGVAAAQASLRQSQNNLRSGYGIFYPKLDANGGATRQRFTPASFGQTTPPSVFNLFTLSATVSYALDIFGGERRQVEQLGAQVDVAQATEEATYLTLTSNIVNTVVAAAAYRAEIDATRELIALQKEQVQLAEVQAKAGTVPYSAVLSLMSQLASYEATIPPLEQKLTQSDDLLATLAGRTPAEWKAAEIRLGDIALPTDLPVSLPSDLVRQRPDILVAEATAHAASANVGVATAALFPSVTLNGALGANGTATRNLFTAGGNFWSFGASIAAPVFDGGTLWYKRKAAIDAYNQTIALYRQTVLGAFGQVADTLGALDHDAATLKAEEEALATASQALRLVQANYKAGLATYLDVLAADALYHQAKIGQLQAIALRYQDTVALFAALGGGWWNAQRAEGRP
jgi:NodT family efflux transporter outer membrane factor (OMF) lipoprotein